MQCGKGYKFKNKYSTLSITQVQCAIKNQLAVKKIRGDIA